jgi:hypothetical protein
MRSSSLLALAALSATAAGCREQLAPNSLQASALALTEEGEVALVPYSSDATHTHMRAPVTAATDAGFFIAWNEEGVDGGALGVTAVVVDATGAVLNAPPVSLNAGLPPEGSVSLAVDGSGVVAAWDCDPDPGGRVCARHLGVGSNGPASAVTMPVGTTGEVVLTSSASAVLLAWTDERVGVQQNVYSCILTGAMTCTPTDGVPVRPAPTVAEYRISSAASADSSEFVVGWYDSTATSPVMLQRISPSGVLLGALGNPGGVPRGDARSAIAARPDGGYWVAMEDARAGDVIYLHTVDANVTEFSGSELALSLLTGTALNPWLAFDASRSVLVVLWENQITGSVEGRERYADGGFSPIVSLAAGVSPRMSVRGDGRGVLVYQRTFGALDRVYFRMIGPAPQTDAGSATDAGPTIGDGGRGGGGVAFTEPLNLTVGCGCGASRACLPVLWGLVSAWLLGRRSRRHRA